MRKVILVFLLLLLPLVFADGMYIPPLRPVEGGIFETHQLLAANLSENRADASLFISIESGSEDELVYLFPFKEKPIFFSVEETNVSAFKQATGVAGAEEARLHKHSYGELADETKNRILISAGALALAPILPVIIPIAYLGVFNVGSRSGGGPSTLSTEGPGSKGADTGLLEVNYFSRGKLEVYNVSDSNIDYILAQYGADPSLKTKFKEYGQMRLYVLTLRPYASGFEKALSACDDRNAALKLLSQEEITYDAWNRVCREIEFSPYYYHEACEFDGKNWSCAPSLQLLMAMAEKAPGFVLHYSQDLPDGQFWYPLGTGQFWENPIGMTSLNFFVPQSTSLSAPAGFERVAYGGKAVYMKKIVAENPDYDIVVSAHTDYIAYAADVVKGLLAFLLELMALLALFVPFIAAFAAGAWLLKKERAHRPYLKSAVFLFAYFFIPLFVFSFATTLLILPLAVFGFLLAFAHLSIPSELGSIVALALLLIGGLAFLALWLGGFYFLHREFAKRVLGKSPMDYLILVVQTLVSALLASAAFLLLNYFTLWLYQAL